MTLALLVVAAIAGVLAPFAVFYFRSVGRASIPEVMPTVRHSILCLVSSYHHRARDRRRVKLLKRRDRAIRDGAEVAL